MLKKVIEYKDFDGNPVKSTYYFHLSKAEITELNYSMPGGLEGYINKLKATESGADAIVIIKKLILLSVGERSKVDATRFSKSDEITKSLTETEAYSVLFMEMAEDPDKLVAFIKGIMPEDLQQQMNV